MSKFAIRIITWQKVHGRHHLPWQNTQNPYAIWVSEIMLQQTQVSAVIGYYTKFMARFPNLEALAIATQDEVLEQWSGLGYYSRARNLHRTAQIIVDQHEGQFPQDFNAILALPGIGRSTAAAISSFAFHRPEPIMDGNVKRVFTRHFLITGWPSLPKIETQLWALADKLMPQNEIIAYTQGLMDLGATLCTRSKPKCSACPLNITCQAYAQDRVNELPTPKPRKILPEKQTTMLIFIHENKVMLEKRPSSGIWGGLWSLPEMSMLENAIVVANNRFGLKTEVDNPLDIIRHVFTHFKLDITPQPLQVVGKPQLGEGSNQVVWMTINQAITAAIPTPVRKILIALNQRLTINYGPNALI